MLETFNYYHKWLGISPKHQPPNYYRLLGIEVLEGDSEVISYAADQRMAHIKSLAIGPHAGLAQKVLNEISSAKICLLNPVEKAKYDRSLLEMPVPPVVAEPVENGQSGVPRLATLKRSRRGSPTRRPKRRRGPLKQDEETTEAILEPAPPPLPVFPLPAPWQVSKEEAPDEEKPVKPISPVIVAAVVGVVLLTLAITLVSILSRQRQPRSPKNRELAKVSTTSAGQQERKPPTKRKKRLNKKLPVDTQPGRTIVPPRIAPRKWSGPPATPGPVLVGHKNDVRALAFFPDGSILATGGDDKKIRFWNSTTGRLLQMVNARNQISAMVFSPDGTTLATGGENKAIWLWNVNPCYLLRSVHRLGIPFRSLAFSPDGKTLAAAGWADRMLLLDTRTWHQRVSLWGGGEFAHCVAFSPDSRTLAVGSDKTIELHDVQSGELLRMINEHRDWAWCVAFSPNGNQLVSSGQNGVIRFWDPETGRLRASLEAHDKVVFSVAFWPGGTLMASAGADSTIKLWDVESRRLLQSLDGTPGPVFNVAFSPDGKILAACGARGLAKLWRLSSETSTSAAGTAP